MLNQALVRHLQEISNDRICDQQTFGRQRNKIRVTLQKPVVNVLLKHRTGNFCEWHAESTFECGYIQSFSRPQCQHYGFAGLFLIWQFF